MTLTVRILSWLSIFALLAGLAPVTHAQEASATKPPASVTEFLNLTYSIASQGSPSLTEGSETDAVVLEVGEANGKGLITWKPTSDCQLGGWCWSIKASAPTDKNSGVTDFVSLDGLAKDLVLEGEWTRRNVSHLETLDLSMDDVCKELAVEDPCGDAEIAEKLHKAALGELNLSGQQLAEARDFLQGLYTHLRKHFSTWSISAKISQNQYKFFELDGSKDEDEEFGVGLKIGYGRLLARHTRLSFAVEGQRSYKAGTTVENCNPVEGSVTLETCEARPLGAPVEQDKLIGRVELRHQFKKWGVSPLLSYEFEENIWGIDVPFYLAFGSDKKTAGGIRLGWRSDTEDAVASVFVSRRLNLLGN